VKAYGVKPQARKSRFSQAEPSENAYMLMYRAKNETNLNIIPDECISEYLRKEVESDYLLDKIQMVDKETRANEM
jgi:hypothetical protein